MNRAGNEGVGSLASVASAQRNGLVFDREVIMSHLLYIKASPRGDRSYSGAVADAFIEAYSRAHPDDQVRTFDVFYDDLPAFDFEAAAAKYKIMHGQDHTEQEKKIWARIVSVIEDFKAADKYVLAVPMWNFSIPYLLKQYMSIQLMSYPSTSI